jgi:hypothetical protein
MASTKKTGLVKNVGETSPRDKMNVTGSDSGLASSGMLGKGVNRSGNRFAGNYASNECKVDMKENFGSGPRTTERLRKESKYEASTPATFDKFREAPDRASGKKPNQGPFTHLSFGNPDKINVGSN